MQVTSLNAADGQSPRFACVGPAARLVDQQQRANRRHHLVDSIGHVSGDRHCDVPVRYHGLGQLPLDGDIRAASGSASPTPRRPQLGRRHRRMAPHRVAVTDGFRVRVAGTDRFRVADRRPTRASPTDSASPTPTPTDSASPDADQYRVADADADRLCNADADADRLCVADACAHAVRLCHAGRLCVAVCFAVSVRLGVVPEPGSSRSAQATPSGALDPGA